MPIERSAKRMLISKKKKKGFEALSWSAHKAQSHAILFIIDQSIRVALLFLQAHLCRNRCCRVLLITWHLEGDGSSAHANFHPANAGALAQALQ